MSAAVDGLSRKPNLTVRTREGQPTVLARLQGLFPNSPGPVSGLPNNSDRGLVESTLRPTLSPRSSISPKFLKIRIITWNMHDSVPKGDLEELFGRVPTYTPSSSPSSTAIPQFPPDANHPYHLILVAGQECPSSSGIPMGLGAGFKLIDKDDRDKEEKPRASKHSHDSVKSKKSYEEHLPEGPPSGWTSMVEDWLCHAGAATRVQSPTISDISIPKPLSPRIPSKEPKKGPYQLLCKERLLGIYLAVYVHRDLKPFVRSISKATVPAGLLGGRWGNKGGVGVSANIDGKSFLFLNCHLAAQVDKSNLQDRLNNFNKIKAELSVDDYLTNEDPRVMAEDPTDKFDYTFLFGDLNFRLDISRLHADWLISRQDYAQALAFDQLKNLMENQRAFVGFREAPINFPPTFKYDVLRTLKRPRRRASKLDRFKYHSEKVQRLMETGEKELVEEVDEEEGEKESEGEAEGEAASLASSVWTSMHSKPATEHDQDEDYSPIANMGRSTSVPTSKVSLSLAAHKAKTKWLSLLSPSTPVSPTKWAKKNLFEQQMFPSKNQQHKSHRSVEDLKIDVPGPASEGSPDPSADQDQELAPPSLRGRLGSTKSNAPSDEDEEADDKGVYDSSHKRRVPSWCDRILFKSTVEPDPEPENTEEESHTRPRTRVGQFIANALRPLSARSRRESHSSLSSIVNSAASTVSTGPKGEPTSPLSSPELLEHIAPFSRFVYADPRSTSSPSDSSSSHTPLVSDNHPVFRPPSNDLDSRLRRSFSSSSRKHNNTNNNTERDRKPRRASTSITPVNVSGSSNTSSDSAPHTTLREHIQTPSRWRFLPSFFTHTSTPSNASEVIPTPATTPGVQVHKKGDVVCLSYDTLDDKGFNKYYPPDYDGEKHGSLNAYRGKHALGDRARKLDQGILITRFELPFNIWCGTCNNHIGMGVRYNAEKKKIGNYYSTPIFSFRCKCHLCDGWFEIQTDPKNTRYVVVSGARQKDEDWNPEENGGFAVHDTEGSAAPVDPLAALEKTTDAQNHLTKVQVPRLESLMDVSDQYNSDPYSLSLKARKRFRAEKKVLKEKEKADDQVKDRYALPTDLNLLEDDADAVKEAREEWKRGRAELSLRDSKRRRLPVETSLASSSTGLLPRPHTVSKLTSSSAVANSLRTRILSNTARHSRIRMGYGSVSK